MDDELEALIARMNDEQDLLFRMAVVRQAIHYVERILPPESEDEGERGCLNVARAWLSEPTPEKSKSMLWWVVAESIDGGLRYHDYAPIFTEPAWIASAEDAGRAIKYAEKVIPENEIDEAKRWQIEAARAISEGRDIPALAPDDRR